MVASVATVGMSSNRLGSVVSVNASGGVCADFAVFRRLPVKINAAYPDEHAGGMAEATGTTGAIWLAAVIQYL